MKLFSITLLSSVLIISGCASSQSYTMKTSPEVSVEGVLPKEDWTITEGGRFAHSLQYEDRLAKPVPYQFTPGKPFEQESIDYFEHLCQTEGKDYIWETATNVDTVAQLSGFEMPNGQDSHLYKRDPFALEAPLFFMESHAVTYNSVKDDLGRKTSAYSMGMPYKLYYYHYQIKDNYGAWDYYLDNNKFSSTKDYKYTSIERINAKYGWTWRGFSRLKDREYAIAGGDLIILDLETGKIMAIQRSFVRAITYSGDRSLNWEGNGCFEQYKNYFLYKNASFEGKTFREKVKTINNAQAANRMSVGFLNKVLLPSKK